MFDISARAVLYPAQTSTNMHNGKGFFITTEQIQSLTLRKATTRILNILYRWRRHGTER